MGSEEVGQKRGKGDREKATSIYGLRSLPCQGRDLDVSGQLREESVAAHFFQVRKLELGKITRLFAWVSAEMEFGFISIQPLPNSFPFGLPYAKWVRQRGAGSPEKEDKVREGEQDGQKEAPERPTLKAGATNGKTDKGVTNLSPKTPPCPVCVYTYTHTQQQQHKIKDAETKNDGEKRNLKNRFCYSSENNVM